MMKHTIALAAVAAAAAATSPRAQSILDIMRNMNSAFFENTKGFDCTWTRGTYMTGHMAHYEVSKNATLLSYAEAWGNYYDWNTCHHDTNANDEAAVQSYIEIARLTNNASRIVPARETMQQQIAKNDTTSWWWIDATFMALPAFARMANYTGDQAFFDQGRMLFEQTAYGKFALWNSDDNLFWRDDTYVHKKCPNGRNVYWSRGNGWAAAALVRTLEQLPASRAEDRAVYLKALHSFAPAIKAAQTSDGYWPASLLDADQIPGPETTGSALFTYALASGINQGVLDASEYGDAVQRGWDYLSQKALQPTGLPGYCQPVAASPSPASPSDWSDFCVGQFLLAASAVLKMQA